MLIIPAIDLFDNEAVRLIQGDYQQKKVYSSSPDLLAKSFEDNGGRLLHIVDLNAARSGFSENEKTIRKLRSACKMKIELGGGIRSIQSMDLFDEMGVDRFVLGTIAVEKPEIVSEALSKFGVDRIVIGVDAKDGIVRIKGWESDTGLSIFKFIEKMFQAGIRHIIFTDITKDGMMLGPNLHIYKEILDEFEGIKLIASGGVSSIQDLRDLDQFTGGRLYGAITGKAVYEGKIDLREAFLEFNKEI